MTARRGIAAASAEFSARRVTLTGRVQGLGVRPAIVRLATELGVMGAVANDARGVTILVEGASSRVSTFEAAIRDCLPIGAIVEAIESSDVPATGATRFEIVSAGDTPGEIGAIGSDVGPLAARVPPDRGVCDACLAESFDPADRRFGYPFTSCASCGPRFSLIRSLPYERSSTAMAGFPLCAACRHEYENPSDRRFHAETTACPECGPQVWLTDLDGARVAERSSALMAASERLVRGQIVALRGVGGYQLVCDATDAAAVSRLRRGKHRPSKPFAVMVDSLPAAEVLARLSSAERAALADPANPIVIVVLRAEPAAPRTVPTDARDASRLLADNVSAGLRTVGLMLPSSPLHAQLARGCGRPLVVTSGNTEGEPLIVDVDESQRKLVGIADAWLHHDRPIVHPVDDSVVRVIAGRRTTIRLARGLAPLPLAIRADRTLLAVGGHQKAAVAVSNGAQAVLGPHLGDLDSPALRRRWEQSISRLTALLRTAPTECAHDFHPDYHATRWATDVAARGVAISAGDRGRTVGVPHHPAHVVAGMIEPGWLDREVLGVAFDGAGLGPDGTIWGGEFLLCSVLSFRRVARLRPFPLLGGGVAARQPWRVALALLDAVGRAGSDFARSLHGDVERTPRDPGVVSTLLRGASRFPLTSSVGRLFDGVAAIVLGIGVADHEGDPAMRLEDVCDLTAVGAYRLPVVDGNAGEPLTLDWRELLIDILADLAGGAAPGVIAMRFHRALARAVAAVCRRFVTHPVVLSGGVMQNRVLVELIADELRTTGQPLALPGEIPVNDGGLAAGQLAIALATGRLTSPH